MTIEKIFIFLILSISAISVIIAIAVLMMLPFAYYRALKAGYIGMQSGMIIDKKTGKCIGTKTALYQDPKTGIIFKGKTVVDNEG